MAAFAGYVSPFAGMLQVSMGSGGLHASALASRPATQAIAERRPKSQEERAFITRQRTRDRPLLRALCERLADDLLDARADPPLRSLFDLPHALFADAEIG